MRASPETPCVSNLGNPFPPVFKIKNKTAVSRSLIPVIRFLVLAFAVLLSVQSLAADFVVRDIRVDGLQRISPGTVFNHVPLRVGERLKSADSGRIIRALYKTGYFNDVKLARDGDVLIIKVVERPAIANISITGNNLLETDKLLKALKDIGLAEGRVFNRSVLDKIEQELRRQYFSQGRYAVQLDATVTPLERNRVDVAIKISEGETARIKRIDIVGNQAFSDKQLMEGFKSGVPGWLDFFSDADQYSRQKLAADLETLRSYYLDRGYIKFKVESTQVSITPDKKDIYITININEGDVYRIKDIQLAGKLVVDQKKVFPLIHLARGQVFSRKAVVGSAERIDALLGDQGYAFANVNSIPEIDDKSHEVSVTFYVDPGKRVYVRRININGNSNTRDEVLRRELRQMERAWFSNAKTKLSRERLQRLGFFEEVNIETPAVPGSNDEVDVDISVKEKPSGNFIAGLGISQSDGLLLNTSISEENFFGTGKRVVLGLNTSSSNTLYQLSYTNPYYTVDGISRGFNLKYRKTDFANFDSADYKTDTGTFGVNFGIPISEFNRFGFGFDAEYIRVKLGNNPAAEIRDFVDTQGDSFWNFKVNIFWSHDSRNSAIFPTSGSSSRFFANATIPGSDLTFYKVGLRHRQYIPLNRTFTLGVYADLGFGDGYGDLDRLPFFDNFFAGGFTTVRGFKRNSLGPRDSNDDPIGGNLRVVGNLELLFPPPIKSMRKSMRMAAFFDIGNVYNTTDSNFDSGSLRYSAGLAMTWLSPVGILTLGYGFPLNDQEGDNTESLQFSFGTSF